MPLTSFTISIHGGELGGVLGLRPGLGNLGTIGAGSLLVCLPTGEGEGLDRFNSARSSGVSLPGAGLFCCGFGFLLILVGALPLGLVSGTILNLMGLEGCRVLEDGLEGLG